MKKLGLTIILTAFSITVKSQIVDVDGLSLGNMTIGNETGTLYQFAGAQSGTDTTNQHQGGFGVLSGSNQISPILWMYGNSDKNAFQVIRKSYNSTVQSGAVLFQVSASGKVGIGTSNPEEMLDVKGTVTIDGNIGNVTVGSHWQTGKHTLELQNTDAGDVVLSFHRAGYTNAAIKHPTIGGLIFSATGGYDQNHMYLKTNGNVGIGTTNPDSKLTVAGNIHSREVKVTVNAGADFVFEENYNLPSLEEVQQFIQENGHLPEIASAKDMETNGIQLGEMNIRLLQKIEELTLYTIEQQKEIETLKKLTVKVSSQDEEIENLKKLLNQLLDTH